LYTEKADKVKKNRKSPGLENSRFFIFFSVIIIFFKFSALSAAWLDDLCESAGRKHPDLLETRFEINIENEENAILSAAFLPAFKIRAKLPELDFVSNLIKTNLTAYSLLSGSLGLNQKLPAGGNFSLDYSLSSEKLYTNFFLKEKAKIRNNALRASLSWDFLQKDRYYYEKQRITGRLKYLAIISNFKKISLKHEIKKLYYSYLASLELRQLEKLRIDEDNKFNKKAQKKYSAGAISEFESIDFKNDLLISKIRLFAAEKRVKDARSELLYILQLSDLKSAKIKTTPQDIKSVINFNETELINNTAVYNPEINQIRLLGAEAEIRSREYKDSLLPGLQLSADGGVWMQKVFPQKTASSDVKINIMCTVALPGTGQMFKKKSAAALEQTLAERYRLDLERITRILKLNIEQDIQEHERIYRIYLWEQELSGIYKKDYEISMERFEAADITSWHFLNRKNRYFDCLKRITELKYNFLIKTSEISSRYFTDL